MFRSFRRKPESRAASTSPSRRRHRARAAIALERLEQRVSLSSWTSGGLGHPPNGAGDGYQSIPAWHNVRFF